MTQKNVIIFCVGRDLLEGGVLDRNANFLAERLTAMSFRVQTIQVLDDLEEEMVPAFQQALARKPSFIIVTGGMGPGPDDLTRETVAKAAGLPLKRDDSAIAMLATSFRRWAAKGIVDNAELNEDRLSIADVPAGSVCFENPIGTAPAVQLKVGPTTFFLLPGVPTEMQRLFDLYVGPALLAEGPGVLRKTSVIIWNGGDESALTRILREVHRRFPSIHARARVQGPDHVPSVRISLSAEHTDEKELDNLLAQAEADLRARLGLEMAPQERPADPSE